LVYEIPMKEDLRLNDFFNEYLDNFYKR